MITAMYIDLIETMVKNMPDVEAAKRRLTLTVIFNAVYACYNVAVREKEFEGLTMEVIGRNWNVNPQYVNDYLVKDIIPSIGEREYLKAKYPLYTFDQIKKYVYKWRLIKCVYFLEMAYKKS